MDDIDDVEVEVVSTRKPEQPTELSKTSSALAPSAKFDRLDNIIKVLLSHVYFGVTKEKCMMAKTFTDMGLLFRPASRQVSICFRRMRDEVVIPFGEVIKCELVSERELVVKLRSDFTRAYYSHPDGFPYKKEPVLLNNDPTNATNGYFSGVNQLLIRSYHATDFDFLSEHGFKIKSENLHKKKTNEFVENPIASTSSSNGIQMLRQSVDNSIKISPQQPQQETSPKLVIENYVAVTQKIVSKTKTVTKSFRAQSSKFSRNISSTFQPSTPQNESNLQNSIQSKKTELYLTCTFASEKRAFIYPPDGTLYHLHFAIRQRFKKHQWNNTWFKTNKSNEDGSWYPLESEDDWKNFLNNFWTMSVVGSCYSNYYYAKPPNYCIESPSKSYEHYESHYEDNNYDKYDKRDADPFAEEMRRSGLIQFRKRDSDPFHKRDADSFNKRDVDSSRKRDADSLRKRDANSFHKRDGDNQNKRDGDSQKRDADSSRKRDADSSLKKRGLFKRDTTSDNSTQTTTGSTSTQPTPTPTVLTLEEQLLQISQIIVNPPEVELGPDGWPDKSIYDPANDSLYWWRNDPVLNQHHEHWHIVMISAIINESRKDREGENFIYMHRHMLARYDAERLGVGFDIVDPLVDYYTPIPEAFYPPPYLVEDFGGKKVPFPARPANQTFRDIVNNGQVTVYSVAWLTHTFDELEKWIDGYTDSEHPVSLELKDEDATKLGSEIELILHNIGHSMLGYMMHPYSIGYAPSVLVGARAGTRDPLFWRWHRHIDNIYKKWQDALGPSDFHHDAPNVTIRPHDIYFAFTDVLLEAYPEGRKDNWQSFANKIFGGDNFDRDLSNSTFITNELHTKMKNRILVWREDNYDKENITYLYPRDWQYFIRVRNDKNETIAVTFRIFIVPEELADSRVHWIELDKFKRFLKPYEKTVIVRECDKAIDIRKPAQKTEAQMDSTQITNETKLITAGHDEGEIAELLFCDCGWPYNLIIPRGKKEGLNFKLIVFITDGTDDLVPTYDECGSTLLCGAHYWKDKIPDIRPLGYPFDRPFKNNSYKLTFEGLSNAAIRDFTIVWTDTDFREV
ncbi:3403_t:CDS:10 [Dentiscutata erythropus]|uniref:3403_t:CDS:1 n=1 Tax=Dentiscutata erythropus TaxID=1348616 RepID=A0A9N8VE09_9GLOM|nr:3403_t:CDS:10 [Dentiscutata erythropus]